MTEQKPTPTPDGGHWSASRSSREKCLRNTQRGSELRGEEHPNPWTFTESPHYPKFGAQFKVKTYFFLVNRDTSTTTIQYMTIHEITGYLHSPIRLHGAVLKHKGNFALTLVSINYIQGDPWLVDITTGDNFLGIHLLH